MTTLILLSYNTRTPAGLPYAHAARLKPDEVKVVAQRVADLQMRSGQLSSYKALTLMRSDWPIGASRDPNKPWTPQVGLYRIIGNPLPPRHDVNQLHDNLRYLLDNEPPLLYAHKIFVLNRLNSSLEKAVTAIVESYGHESMAIKFDVQEYQPHQMEDTYGLPAAEWGDLINRKFHRMNANLYVMNNNGARNAALRHGIQQGWRWTMPFDGNCFFTTEQWLAVLTELEAGERKGAKYAAVPMVRTTVDLDGSKRVPGDKFPAPTGLAADAGPGEHQIAFHSSASLRFDPTTPYGHRPKVSMLWKLGIPGAWDSWNHDTVFRSEGACYFLGGERTVKAPSICSRTLPSVDKTAAVETFSTVAVVYRLPDSWPQRQQQPSDGEETPNGASAAPADGIPPPPSGESFESKANRRDLRDEGIFRKIGEMDAMSPSLTAGADSFIKPIFFNIFSMEAMRRECLVHKAECAEKVSDLLPPTQPVRSAVDQHHCTQIEAVVHLANLKLRNKPMSVVDKVAFISQAQRPLFKASSIINSASLDAEMLTSRTVTMKFPQPPQNATPHYFQNIGPYDWRLAELPNDLDLSRIQIMRYRPLAKFLTANKDKILDPAFRMQYAEEFVKWEGHVRPDGRLWGPGSAAYDRTRAYEMMSNVTLFALAHFYSGRSQYAEKAAALIRTWFIDSTTRMHPSTSFAHWSRASRNMFGVIQLKDLAFAFDALALIERTRAWTLTDAFAMRQWCLAYLSDLNTSHERTAKTTHGWWFVMQYAAVARCAGSNSSHIRAIISERVTRLVDDPDYHREDGIMPHEMIRSRALHNHFFTSYALVLAWRALQNLGDANTAQRLATALRSTVKILNSAVTNITIARYLSLDDSAFLKQRTTSVREGSLLGTLALEYVAPLCQWALDYDLEFGTTLSMCKRIDFDDRKRRLDPRVPPLPSMELEQYYWPPLLPSAPHTGVFPFMNLMW